jgi:hypothetical protein
MTYFDLIKEKQAIKDTMTAYAKSRKYSVSQTEDFVRCVCSEGCQYANNIGTEFEVSALKTLETDISARIGISSRFGAADDLLAVMVAFAIRYAQLDSMMS